MSKTSLAGLLLAAFAGVMVFPGDAVGQTTYECSRCNGLTGKCSSDYEPDWLFDYCTDRVDSEGNPYCHHYGNLLDCSGGGGGECPPGSGCDPTPQRQISHSRISADGTLREGPSALLASRRLESPTDYLRNCSGEVIFRGERMRHAPPLTIGL